MAKAKTLAALAGLAGLAYAYNKNKNKDDSSTTDSESGETTSSKKDADDNDTLARVNREEASGITKSKSDVLKALTAPKAAPNDKAPSQGVLPPKTVTPPKVKPKLETYTTRKDPREAEAGTSRGQRSFTSRSSGDEMSSAAKSYKAPAPTTSSKVGDAATDAVKTVAKAAVQGPAASMATAAKPLADKATNAMRETYRDLSGKVQYKTPDIPSAAKTASDAVASGAKKVGSGIADYANRTFTLEGRERAKKEADDARAKAASSREYDEDVLSKGSAMRRGGMTKMASGGMTASSRGDGIASRGKTRGKIC
jgi:hypothetical protein